MIIHILGTTGMLGRYVSKFLSTLYNVKEYNRSLGFIIQSNTRWMWPDIKHGDVVVNCIGVIKPQIEKYSEPDVLFVNSLFPRLLADYCERIGATCVHVTTDCVYSGKQGTYTERSETDVTDLYGRSKALGEPMNATVIRTSIIGEEEHGNTRSLLEWLKASRGTKICGFINHSWNGITCLEFAKMLSYLISRKHFPKGTFHVTSPEDIDKYNLCCLINKIYQLDLTVEPMETKVSCNRTLRSVYNPPLYICSSLETQIHELYDFRSLFQKQHQDKCDE